MSDAREWLEQARDELLTVKTVMEKQGKLTGQACFHSQLAAEKAIKASLIFLEIKFPLDHNLTRLSNLLPADWAYLVQQNDLNMLSDWAVNGRYYNTTSKPSIGQAQEAYRQAKAVVSVMKKSLEEAGLPL
ncbi:HEPN domain-containing protein [cf. Phormidesmis sp. LEGE 11477]|uniref:HEPN domain-containing protein n=1 Tax=cf. Phormidesmis sp. LEGE 11477 TaxID=1828680 RepID=UPI00188178EE|nr:HEPN domain-containing protein [cf. Phormidesmis sp. LEGE 11477]MBE9064647.1 HEPN domain-containing protein [cf. Phormidesmis sp. LEGE 11477]